MTTATSIDPGDRDQRFNLRLTAAERDLVAVTARTLGCSQNTAVAVLIEKGSLFPLNPDSAACVLDAAAVWGISPRQATTELIRLGWERWGQLRGHTPAPAGTTPPAGGTTPPAPGQTSVLDDDQGTTP